MADSTVKFELYHYYPSTAAAVIFIVLFGLVTIFHTFKVFQKQTWYFIPFLIGGYFETIGYIGRVLSSRQSPNWTTTPYIMQSLLLLLGPALFAASIYMILARIIRLLEGEKHSIIRTKWLTSIFVTGDVLSFFVQSGGGGIMAQAKKQSTVKLGENIITAGLFIQVFFFGIFIIVAGIFHYRVTLEPTNSSLNTTLRWRKHLVVLYLASTLILTRSIFRIAEYISGYDGPLLRTEVYLYVFDGTLMVLMMAGFAICHPSQIINGRTKMENRDGIDMEAIDMRHETK